MALGITGITTSVVSQEIGLSSNDVGELCQGIKLGSGLPSKINKWSPYKPISNSTLPRTAYIRGYVSGFSVDPVTKLLTHIPPTGGTNSPYCLGDFREYEHSAIVCPAPYIAQSGENPKYHGYAEVLDTYAQSTVPVQIILYHASTEMFRKIFNEHCLVTGATVTVSTTDDVPLTTTTNAGSSLVNYVSDNKTIITFQFPFPSTVSTTSNFKLWFGSPTTPLIFKIPDSQDISARVQVLRSYPYISMFYGISPYTDLGTPYTQGGFVFGTASASVSVYNKTYNPDTKVLVIPSLTIAGTTQNRTTFFEGATNSYIDFSGFYTTDSYYNTTQMAYSIGAPWVWNSTNVSNGNIIQIPFAQSGTGVFKTTGGGSAGVSCSLTIMNLTVSNIDANQDLYIYFRRDPNKQYTSV